VNVHEDSSRGGSIEFVLCAIDTHPVWSNSNYTEEVIKEEGISDGTAVLNNVMYSPQMNYNLCSFSRLM